MTFYGDTSESITKEHVSRLNKMRSKAKHLKHGKDKETLNSVIGFSKINLNKDNILLQLLGPFHTLPNINGVVKNKVRFDEGSLLRMHNLRKQMPNFQSQHFGNYLE